MKKWKCTYSFVTDGEVIVEADSRDEADEKGMQVVKMIGRTWEVEIEELEADNGR